MKKVILIIICSLLTVSIYGQDTLSNIRKEKSYIYLTCRIEKFGKTLIHHGCGRGFLLDNNNEYIKFRNDDLGMFDYFGADGWLYIETLDYDEGESRLFIKDVSGWTNKQIDEFLKNKYVIKPL